MKKQKLFFVPLSSALVALAIVGCVNSHSSAQAETTNAVSPQNPATNTRAASTVVPVTSIDSAVKTTNSVANAIIVAAKDKPETNKISSGVLAATKMRGKDAASGCPLAFDLSWLWSPKDYWYALVGALLGALIGIFWANRGFKKERREVGLNAIERLKTCIQFNLTLLEGAKKQFVTGSVPNYPFDTAQLNHWLIQSHEFISPELLKAIDWQRYQLDHISTKIIVANVHVLVTNGAPLNAIQLELKQALINSLAVHVDIVLKELPPLLNQLPKKNESR